VADRDHGPFETEDQARTPAVLAVYEAFDADPGVGKMAPHNLAMLTSACQAAGVALGAYDARVLAWLGSWEPQTCAVIAGIIRRACEAGKTAAAEGTVTQWGLRLAGESCEPIFDAYPGEEAARYALPGFQGVFGTAVVRRECGPWKEAPDTCRHCGQRIRRCPHPAGAMPVCKGWRHEGHDDQLIGAHYCGGRSVNPAAEPATRETREDDGG
jgi:hypothetical protein